MDLFPPHSTHQASFGKATTLPISFHMVVEGLGRNIKEMRTQDNIRGLWLYGVYLSITHQ